MKKGDTEDGTGTQLRQRPVKSLAWTVLAVAVSLLLHWQTRYLNETWQMDPAVPWIISALLGVITVLVWASWAFFFRRSLLLGMTILAAPTILLTLFYPDFGGDSNFLNLRPRFWESRDLDFVEPQRPTPGIELTTTSVDFPQFLGPDRNLKVDSVQLAEWDDPPEAMWKITVGDGWSGFVVVDGFAITQEQRQDEECVTCYDVMTGEAIWVNRQPRRHEDVISMGKSGPRATPTVNDGRVYATSATGVLDCLDASTGELIWSANIPAMVGIEQQVSTNSRGLEYTSENSTLTWGRAGSPLVVDDLVIVPAGGPRNASELDRDPTATLIALNRITGVEVWRGGHRQISYGSPSLTTIDGVRQITLISEQHAVGHDLETGEELWSWEREGGSDGPANCSQVTRIDKHRYLLSKAYGLGGELIEVERSGSGDTWQVTSLKKDPRVLRTKMTNPVIVDGHAYSLTDVYLECVEILPSAPFFKRKWRQRGRFGNGQLLAVGDKLLVHAEYGQLYLVDSDPESYRVLGEIETVDGFCWNTICLYGDLVLVRSQLEAACYRLPIRGDKIPETSAAPPSESMGAVTPDAGKSNETATVESQDD